MVSKVKIAPLEEKDEVRCRHYWVIESPHGPTSRGVCRLCGEEKEFPNFMPDFSWDGDQSSLFRTAGARDAGSGKDEDYS